MSADLHRYRCRDVVLYYGVISIYIYFAPILICKIIVASPLVVHFLNAANYQPATV